MALHTTADFAYFETLARRACAEQDERKKEGLCREAVRLYQEAGGAAPGDELEFLAETLRRRLLYIDTLKELGGVCERREAWEELEALCREALKEEPLDETFHCWLLRSLCRQQKGGQALQHYETFSEQLYDSMGIRDTDLLREMVQEIAAEGEDRHMDHVEQVIAQMKEERKPDGAFLCDYPSFREIYRLEARRIGRLGVAEYVLLLTVCRAEELTEEEAESGFPAGQEGGAPDSEKAPGFVPEPVMERLGALLHDALRIGDAAAKFSERQYIVLLPTCSYEAAVMVAKRLCTAFRAETDGSGLGLRFELAEVTGTE